MDKKDSLASFLDAVDALRADDTAVRTTAHTSSVSSDGWTLVPDSKQPIPQESALQSSKQ